MRMLRLYSEFIGRIAGKKNVSTDLDLSKAKTLTPFSGYLLLTEKGLNLAKVLKKTTKALLLKS
jgi:hypothetical protein